ncbi:hypothetical protein FRC12_006512 [Ceratobasidium sp. 428]|nr:hypothetical protein FRC12_006512 [Ceratobasidium sp. 428]
MSDIGGSTKTYRPTKKRVSVLHCKKKFTVVLVGEVDSGKASFASSLVNLFQGYGALELTDQHDEGEAPGNDKGHNQAAQTILHQMVLHDSGPIVRIIDTPNFGTKGGSPDISKTRNFIKIGVDSIDAVMVVADGHAPGFPEAAFTAVMDLFPRTVAENICFVSANTDWMDWKSQAGSLPPELRNIKHWHLHNPLATLRLYSKVKKDRPSDKLAAEELLDEVETHYNRAVKTLDSWVEWVDSRTARLNEEVCEPFNFKEKIQKKFEAITTDVARFKEVEEELEEIDSDIKRANNEASVIRRKIPQPIRNIPSLPVGGPPPFVDSSTPEQRMAEAELRKKQEEISRLKSNREPVQEKFTKAENAMKTTISHIGLLLDDFHKFSFGRSFASSVDATIQMLENRKQQLNSKPHTAKERQIIDDTIKEFREKVRTVDK